MVKILAFFMQISWFYCDRYSFKTYMYTPFLFCSQKFFSLFSLLAVAVCVDVTFILWGEFPLTVSHWEIWHVQQQQYVVELQTALNTRTFSSAHILKCQNQTNGHLRSWQHHSGSAECFWLFVHMFIWNVVC